METTGDIEIPFNMVIDNAAEANVNEDCIYSIVIFGVSHDIRIFSSVEEYTAADTCMAIPSMIPVGTFPDNWPENTDDQVEETHQILFTGTIEEFEKLEIAGDNMPNYLLLIETLEMELFLYIRYEGPIEEGYIAHGNAWLFGDLPEAEGELIS